jgi:ribonuclease HII
MNYIIGIDEAGRGPWAWPIVVGGWFCEKEKYEENIKTLHGLGDSKKLSEIKRENIFYSIEGLQERNLCQYTFAYREAHEIDSLGIREANRLCMQDVLLSLLQYTEESDFVEIYIDGSDNFIFDGIDCSYTFAKKRNQKEKGKTWERKEKHIYYIIWWDATIPTISSASIIAKVTRDRMMCDFHENFPEYWFNIHKGYGTRKHSEALVNYGITPLHRKSYAPVKKLIF